MTVSEGVSARALGGESDLRRAVDELAECTAILPLGSNLFEISFRAPAIARLAQPGEFAQIWVEPGHAPLLRRPFSFSRSDPRSGVISFYLGVVGQGTRRLSSLSPGASLKLLGPLGQGFTLPDRPGRSALVSGGLGAAPFPLLAERLRALGEQMVWVNGARNRSELYPDELIPEGMTEVIQFTEDGSRGRLGRVTAGLPPLLSQVDRVYACGPNPMLEVVAALIAGSGASPKPELEVSIEAPMGCGFGTCLGCAIPLRLPSTPDVESVGLCCRHGPVLRGGVLDWERLKLQPAHLS